MTANDEPETTSMPQFTFRPFSAVVAAFRQVDSAIREQDPRGDRDELGLVMGLDRWPDLDRISDVFTASGPIPTVQGTPAECGVWPAIGPAS